jgi:FkbM family methyltransferase
MESRVTLYKGMYWLRDDGDGVTEEYAAVNSSCHELLTVFPDVPKKIAEFVSFKGVVVQAGGNNGLYAKQYAELFDTVYTFEPIPELFYCLNRNLTSDNVFKFQACLGNTHSLVGLGRKLNNNGGSSNICGGGNTPTMRIDDLGLSRCDLIHLDIEGFEMFALDGGRITIERCKPVIVLEESGHCMRFGVDPRQIVSWLESFGYTQIGEVQGDRVYKTRQVG